MSTAPEPSAVWAYAVAEGPSVTRLDELDGVGGGRVRTVAAAGLTTIAGEVPLAEFGEAALRSKLEDLHWLETTARAHHRVIAAVAARQAVVPMRLATVYRDDAGATAALAGHADDLRAALDRVRAHKEWGIKAYATRPRPGAPEAGMLPGRDGPASGPGQAGAGPGAAYLARRRQELSSRESARRDAADSAQQIHARLAQLADQSRLHQPQSPQLAPDAAQMILNAAYLVADDRDGEFAAVVEALGARQPAVRLEVTGPWPPYSFASLPEADPP